MKIETKIKNKRSVKNIFQKTNLIKISSAVALGMLLVVPQAFAAISFGTEANATTTNTTLTISKPASTAAGDILIATIAAHGGSDDTITPPSGWTLILRTNNGTNNALATYYHVVTGSEGSTFAWTLNYGSHGNRAGGGILRYTGVDTSNPVDTSSGNTGTSASPSASNVTTTVANDLLVAAFASDSSGSMTPPTGMTERFDQTQSSGPNEETADAVQSATGASGAKTASGAANDAWEAQLIALRPDTTPPSGGSISYLNGYATTTSVSVTFTLGTDSGSGINTASGKIQRASATLSNGSCGTFGSFANLVTTSTSPYNDTTVANSNCYEYQYLISDNAGNTATYTSTNVAKIDTAAPTIGTVTITPTSGSSPKYISGTSTISATVSDSGSGVASCQYTINGGTTWTAGTFSAGSCSASGVNTAAATSINVRGTDNAGNTGTGTAVAVTPDTTAPSYSFNSPATDSRYKNNATTSVDVSITETGSGITNGTSCNPAISGVTSFTGSITYSTTTQKCTGILTITNGGADGAKQLTVTVADAVGNSQISANRQIQIDNTAPTVTIGSPSASLTKSGPITYTITYGGADTVTLVNANVALNKTGTTTGTVAVTGSGTSTRTVTISSITGDGTLGISIAAGTASDNAGNTAPAAGPSTTFTVDNTAPSVTVTSFPAVTNANNTAVTLSGACETGLTVSLAVTNASSSVNATSTCASSAWSKVLNLSTLPDGTLTATVSQTDAAGNTGSGSLTSTKISSATLVVNLVNSTSGSATYGDFILTVLKNGSTTVFNGSASSTQSYTLNVGDTYRVAEATTTNSQYYTVSPSASCTGTMGTSTVTCTITNTFVPPPLGISPTELANGTIDAPYAQTLTATTAATGTISWTLTSGALPNGLSLTSATGPTTSIAGTPSVTGVFNFTIKATVGLTSSTQGYTITVSAAVANLIQNPNMLDATVSASNPDYWHQGGYGNNTRIFSYPLLAGPNPGDKAAEVSVSNYVDGAADWYFDHVAITGGATYSFSDWYNSTNTSYLAAEYTLADNSNTYPILATLPSTGGVWTSATQQFTAPPNAVSVTVYHFISGNGSLATTNYSLTLVAEPGAYLFPQGLVSLTFDDGWQSQFDNAVPVLYAAHLHGTFYIITNAMLNSPDDPDLSFMSTSSVLSLQNTYGEEIGSHTEDHCDLVQLFNDPNSAMTTVGCPDNPLPAPSTAQDQIDGSKTALTDIGVTPVDTFAYPYGSGAGNTSIEGLLSADNFAAGRSVIQGYNLKNTDPYALQVQVVDASVATNTIHSWIDYAAANKVWLILLFHQIETSTAPLATEVDGTTQAVLQDTVDYLNGKKGTGNGQIGVDTIHDVMAQYININDTTPPVITLIGSSTVNTEVGTPYVDAGATALDNIDGDLTTHIVTTSTVNINQLGAYTVTYNVSDAHGNAATPVVRTVNVIPRAITVTADAKTKVYGAVDPALTYQITSGTLIASDTFSGALIRDAGENVGAYAIKQGTLALNGNYTLTFVTSTLNITAASVTVSATGHDKVYDGTTNATANLTVNGVVNGDLLTASGTALFADANAGTAKLVTVTGIILNGTSAANYNFNDTATTTAAITKANPTIIVTPYAVPFDGAAHTATGTAKGVLDEALSGLDLTGTTHTDAAGYPTDPWTFTDATGNYNNATGTVADAIGKVDATINVTGYTGVYDGAAHSATGTATGIGGADLAASLDLGASFTNVPGGTASWTFTGGTNYNDASGTVAIAITKANPTIIVTPYAVPFDGAAHTATGTAKGVLDEALSGLDLTGTTHTDAAGYPTDPWTFTDATGNYNNATGTVADAIGKVDATINVTGYTGVYDGAAHSATGTATGIGGADLAASLDLGASFTNVPGGTASWTFTGGTNYNDASGTVAIAITKANPTIIVTPYAVPFDGAAHTATGTAKGVLDEALSGLDLTGTTHTDAAGYPTDPWTFTDATGNYNNATGTVADAIGKVDATINVTGYTGVYDGAAHSATGTATGIGGADLAASLDLGASFTNVPGGTASWTFTGGTNYNDASGTVAIAITKANPTIIVTPYAVPFDGAAHTATGTAKGVLDEALSGLDLTGTTHTDAAGYPTDPWTFTDATGNYNNATGTVADAIGKVDATINVTGYTGVYDGAAHSATGTATGIGGADLAASLDLGASFTNVPGGTASWTFTGGTNYNDASGTVAIAITKANPTIIVTPYAVPFDGAAHTATGTAKGVLDEALSGLDLTGTTHTDAAGYPTDPWTFTDATGNYNNATGTVADAIGKVDATINVTGYTGVYDGAAHSATGTATGIGGADLAASLDLGASFTNVPGGTASWTFTGGTNYNDASGTVAIAITKANPTIIVTPYAVPFDGAAHTATGTAKGVLDEALSGLDLTGTTHTDAAGYPTDPWTFTDATGNYNNATGTVADAIGKVDATINVTGYTGVYDGAAHSATGTATGIGGADLAASLDLGASFTNVPGGTASWTFTGGTNYNDASGTVAIAITKANPTIIVTPYAVPFDGAAHTATGTAKGVLDEALSGLDLTGTTHTDAAGYPTDPWTFTDATGNYNNATGTVADAIGKVDATINVTGYTGVYDGAAHSATGTATGIGGADLAASLDLGASFTNVPGGTASWTFTGGTNYNDASGTVAIAITKANPTIIVTPYAVPFDGAAHTATGTAKGVLDEALSGLDLTGTTHTDAAGYPTDPWTFTDATGNYNNATGTVADAIAPSSITIALNSADLNQVYDGNPKTVGVTTNPDNLANIVTYDNATTTPVDAGTYAVAATITDPNYAGTATGTLVIAQASQTIAFAPLADVTIGDPDFSISATSTSGLAVTFTATSSDVCTISANTVHLMGPGSCMITAEQASDLNHEAAPNVPQTFTVNNAPNIITVNSADVAITGEVPDTATVGVPYAGAILTVSSTDTGVFNWTVSDLPDGITSIPTGNTLTISGTPTTPTSTTVSVTATNETNASTTVTQTYPLTVSDAPAITIATSSPDVAEVGVSFSQTFTASDSNATDTFTFGVAGLPDGFTSTSTPTTLTIAGTPTTTDSIVLNVNATSTLNVASAGSLTDTITVGNAPAISFITTSPLPDATVGIPYTATITATSTNPADTLTLSTSTPLPAWITSFAVNGDTATISGTPESADLGSSTVNMTATGANPASAPTAQDFSISVLAAPAVTITPPSLNATIGVSYSGNFTASDADASDTFNWNASGTIPGLTFTDGNLTGTPAATGTFPIDVTATNNTNGASTATQHFDFAVSNAPTITIVSGLTPDTATAETPYSATIVATSTDPADTLTWQIAGLPAWATSTPAGDTTTVSGTPHASDVGSSTINVSVNGSNVQSNVASKNYTLTVEAAAPTSTPSSTVTLTPPSGGFNDATVNVLYPAPATIHATNSANATDTFIFAITAGAIPTGMDVSTSSDGFSLSISGTPTATGTFNFSVNATSDSDNSQSASGDYSIKVVEAPASISTITISPAAGALPGTETDTSYSQTFTATNSGNASDTFNWNASGTIPGLNFADGLLSGTPTATGTFPLDITATSVSDGSLSTAQHYTLIISELPPPPPTPTSTLNVTVTVDNSAGGSATPSDFTVTIIGGHPSTSTFPGNASGTLVTVDEKMTYGANISSLTNYTVGNNGDCQGKTAPAGNSIPCAFTETFALPAPIISEQTSTNPTDTSVTITWTTDHPATSRVVYGTASVSDASSTAAGEPNYGYANSTDENAATTTDHSVTVSGLTPGTTYYLRSVSHGSPESVGNEITVTTTGSATQPGGNTGNGGGIVVTSGGGGGGGGGTGYYPPTITTGGGQVLGASTTNPGVLLQLLQSLMQQLIALEKKLVTQQLKDASCSAQFNQNLSQGMNNADVKMLQTVLNMSDLTQVAQSGVGSPGNESTYFGDATKNAVIIFQNIFADEILAPNGLTSGNGYVGSATRSVLNQLCSQ